MTMAYRRKARHFNPRSPRGERLLICFVVPAVRIFQSTLPAGGATPDAFMASRPIRFQSTLPAGGATGENTTSKWEQTVISIHAPRGGSDWLLGNICRPTASFQSTLPAGGATVPCFSVFPVLFLFQSTLPAGGATCDEFQVWYHKVISIHAPRGGSDSRLKSCEEASDCISIHAPRGGSDTG